MLYSDDYQISLTCCGIMEPSQSGCCPGRCASQITDALIQMLWVLIWKSTKYRLHTAETLTTELTSHM